MSIHVHSIYKCQTNFKLAFKDCINSSGNIPPMLCILIGKNAVKLNLVISRHQVAPYKQFMFRQFQHFPVLKHFCVWTGVNVCVQRNHFSQLRTRASDKYCKCQHSPQNVPVGMYVGTLVSRRCKYEQMYSILAPNGWT